MEIKKILIYGSAHLTKVTCDLLENHYELVGHIPSQNPVIGSEMSLYIWINDLFMYIYHVKKKYFRDFLSEDWLRYNFWVHIFAKKFLNHCNIDCYDVLKKL